MQARFVIAAVIAVSALHVAPERARADDYFVDPESGSMSNAGSSTAPWSTLQEVAAAGKFGSTIQPGDTVYLRSGYHGDPTFGNGDYDPAIVVRADQGEAPLLKRLRVNGASGLTFSGLSLSPAYAQSYETVNIVQIGKNSARITVEDCELFSEADVSGWSADQWVNRASSAIDVSGDDAVVRRNRVRNVRFGISVNGQNALIDHNTIDGFSADGLRGLGDNGVFQYNVVKNSYVGDDQDANHDDGFQSWSVGADGEVGTGEVRGVILRGNLILNYEDPAQPLRTSLQGVGCFDGTFVDWVVENNVVITDHWHGITLLGARNCRIVNNTVLDLNDQDPGPPWISIDAHKDGTKPAGCVVRNNIATDYANADTVTADHNLEIKDPAKDLALLFVDPASHDLHLLKSASAAIDQGSADQAAAIDADGIARPQGSAVDLGAYEWHEPGVQPVDAGMNANGGSSGSNDAGTGASGGSAGNAGTSATGGSGSGARDAGIGGAGGTARAGASGGGSGGASARDAGSEGDAAGGAHGSDTDSGCGCRLASTTARPHALHGWLALAVIAALRRGIRRRRRGVSRARPALCDRDRLRSYDSKQKAPAGRQIAFTDRAEGSTRDASGSGADSRTGTGAVNQRHAGCSSRS